MTNHVVTLGDCLDPVTGLGSLPDKSVDHVITDPPYEAEAHTQQRRVLGGGGDRGGVVHPGALDFEPMTEAGRDAAGQHIARVARRWIVLFCQIEATEKWRRALASGGARYVRTMVWTKPNGQPQLTGDRPGMGFECMVVAYGSTGRMRWNAGGKRGHYDFATDANFSREARHHPTQKPLPLIDALVRDFTDPGETVLDPFAGSGTTGVACKRLGRSFIGWERDPKYHAIAVKRIAAAREQLGLWTGAA